MVAKRPFGRQTGNPPRHKPQNVPEPRQWNLHPEAVYDPAGVLRRCGGLRALTTPVLIGVCVGLAGVVVLLSVLLVLRRAAHQTDERLTSVVRALDGRIDDLARDVARVLETSEER